MFQKKRKTKKEYFKKDRRKSDVNDISNEKYSKNVCFGDPREYQKLSGFTVFMDAVTFSKKTQYVIGYK